MGGRIRLFADASFISSTDGPRHARHWGYDLTKVPEVWCMECREPIGQEKWIPDDGLGRFGTMLFYHARCYPA